MTPSIFEKQAYEAMKKRLDSITPASQRQWGTMTVSQMLAHCQQPMGMILDHRKLPRSVVSYIFGGFFKKMATNNKPYKQGLPTDKTFIIHNEPEFQAEKEKLAQMIDRLYQSGEKAVTPHPHPFFGKMTPVEWGKSQYKHLDHHFRQFGA
ncbi:MAG: DUF1569 domain-containing protein [Bacteroidetes bacterium]|nr:DUF1569 domain-containing protein [Bacteroidota bacterium]